jgi:hypothetical protein
MRLSNRQVEKNKERLNCRGLEKPGFHGSTLFW